MRRALATLLWLSLGACGDDAARGGMRDTPSDGEAAVGHDAASGDAAVPRDAGTTGDAAAPAADAAGTDDVSFARHVAPTFAAKCTYCHHADSASGVDLTRPFDAALGLVGRASRHAGARSPLLVDPGNPGGSFLLDKLRAGDLDADLEGAPMPWHVPRLDDAELGAVRQWIDDGARDDAFFRDRVAPIFGDGISLPGEGGGKCSYCHYPGTPGPPDLTNPFDPVTGVVGVMGASGLLVAPGDAAGSLLVKKVEGTLGVQMPFWPPPLSATELDTIERWISAGARDD